MKGTEGALERIPARVYHYTSIDTLALILRHRTIRFNRLDHADDIMEVDALPDPKLARALYIGSWTDDPDENLALWSMYGIASGGQAYET